MCGVVGLIAPEQTQEELAVELTLRLLHDSRNRGEDGSGFLIYKRFISKDHTQVERWLGSAYEGPLTLLRSFKSPQLILAHARYATAGRVSLENIHPAQVNCDNVKIYLVMNGEVSFTKRWRQAIEFDYEGETDTTDCAARILSFYLEHRDLNQALAEFYREAFPFGGFTILGLLEDKGEAFFFYLRDGMRPLHRAQFRGFYLFTSETAPLTSLDIPLEDIMIIPPGEVGIYSFQDQDWIWMEMDQKRGECAFEVAYFQRPISILYGKSMNQIRMKLGKAVFEEHPPPERAIVTPVPKSGIGAAWGYAEAALKAGLKINLGGVILRKGSPTRSFLGEDQSEIVKRLRAKFAIDPAQVKGRKIINIDDSVVRGNASAFVNQLERQVGAKEVHFIVAWPPIIGPCRAGIALRHDDPLVKNLELEPLDVAKDHSVLEKILAEGYTHPEFGYTQFDSVGYLSIEAVHKILGELMRDYCTGCFTNVYSYERNWPNG